MTTRNTTPTFPASAYVGSGPIRFGSSLYHATRTAPDRVADHGRVWRAARDAYYTDAARCSCGCAFSHRVSHTLRLTTDGCAVWLWSDGTVEIFNDAVNVGFGGGETDKTVAAYVRAGWEALEWAETYSAAELRGVIAEARKRHLRAVEREARIAAEKAERAA